MNSYNVFQTRPKTRKHTVDKSKREEILARFGSAMAFFRATGLENKVERENLYRAMRGEPVNIKVATAISCAWHDIIYKHFSRELAEKILEAGVEIAKKETKVPLKTADIFETLKRYADEKPY